MRFLADENFPRDAVVELQSAGHDIAWVRTAAPGVSDAQVLAWAVREGRILLTFDKDFGELVRGAPIPATCGVILFRVPMPKPRDAGKRIAALVAEREDWIGHFSVIEPGRVRMRRLA